MTEYKVNLIKMLNNHQNKVHSYRAYNETAEKLYKVLTDTIFNLNQELATQVNDYQHVKINIDQNMIEWLGIYYQLSMNASGTVNIISIDPVNNDTNRLDIVIELEGELFSSKYNQFLKGKEEDIVLKWLTSHDKFNNINIL